MPQRQHGQPTGTPQRAGRQGRPLLSFRYRFQGPLRALVYVSHLAHPPSVSIPGADDGLAPARAGVAGVAGFRPGGACPVVSIAETTADGQGDAGDEDSRMPHAQLLVNSTVY
jgi:hypothetical protein